MTAAWARRLALCAGLAWAAAAPAAGGGAAPAFSLPGLDGVTHRLEDWRGRVLVVNFWASWCGPCLREIPELVSVQGRLGPRGVSVVSIGLDEAKKLGNVARSLGINYPVLVAGEDEAARFMLPWGNSAGIVPYTVVVDPAGRMVQRHRGPLEPGELEEMLKPLLAPAGSGPRRGPGRDETRT